MDLDEELLALAGGDDSSDNERDAAPLKHASPRPDTDNENDEVGRVNLSKRRDTRSRSQHRSRSRSRSRSGSRPRGRSPINNDNDDAVKQRVDSSPSRASLNSASMSESDSEGGSVTGGDSEGLKPPYAYEKYFYSAKEKEEIMALPEIQREETLSERAQVHERYLQDIALRRLLATREREEAAKKRKKRKSSSSDLEDSPRKSTRQKMTVGGSRKVGEVSNAIEAYKKQREQKEKRDRARKRKAPGKKEPSSCGDNEDDSEASDRAASDVEWVKSNNRRRSTTPPKDDPPADLHDINRARIGRSGFAQLCFYPKFEELISHCFVRLAIGYNRSANRNEYRLTQIKGFREGKPYAMEGMNKRNFVTNQYALLAHGKAVKEFPFIACSDSPFTEGEFNRWRQTMVVEDCPMPTKSQVIDKVTDINNLINHSFTKEELDEKLKRQGAASSKQIAFERLRLEKERAKAIAANDEALIAECDENLRRLIGPAKLAFGTSLNKNTATKPSSTDSAERLQELNRRNARLNAENVRRAQLEERRQHKLKAAKFTRQEIAGKDKMQTAQTQSSAPIKSTESGSTSASVTATSGGWLKDEGSSRSQDTRSNGINNYSSSGPPSSQTSTAAAAAAKKSSIPSIRHRPTDDDNIAALDLGLDIDM
ncbi:hypothetical protein KEM54_000578 [Ascosphaera aggregata]|nr:hypothetical protein KEM54_000578 [Ascosphaera aggregata]